MIKLKTIRGKWGLVPLAAITLFAAGSKDPSPPTFIQEGIKLATWKATNYGWEISWEVEDDRIAVGYDAFIIQMSERQIPARTGWSPWREIGRTKDLKFAKAEFIRAKDVRLRIVVDKGAME